MEIRNKKEFQANMNSKEITRWFEINLYFGEVNHRRIIDVMGDIIEYGDNAKEIQERRKVVKWFTTAIEAKTFLLELSKEIIIEEYELDKILKDLDWNIKIEKRINRTKNKSIDWNIDRE